MNGPKISIIVPVYNVEKYLSKCINSILSQTYKNIEVICVNDQSPDSSLNILKEYNDERLIVIDKENDYGKQQDKRNHTGVQSRSISPPLFRQCYQSNI